jgi:MtN3 and saliva related transmembrane protein
MAHSDIVGLTAGFLTTVSFIPQLLRMHRTRSAKDISPHMYSMYAIGVLIWIIYGVMLDDFALIFWNGAALVFACLVLAMKFNYDRANQKRTSGPRIGAHQ